MVAIGTHFGGPSRSPRRRRCPSAPGAAEIEPGFDDLPEAQKVLDRWRKDYNNVRPYGSLARLTPAHFGAGGHFTPGPERLAD